MIEILTKWQQERFDEFEEAIHRNGIRFINGRIRRIGKTYLINELALTLQALDYTVYVFTSYQNIEYFAEKFIQSYNNLRGINRDKKVILFDEVRIDEDETMKILELCEKYSISVVGFTRYKGDEDVKEFKTEFECEWIKNTY